METINFQLTVEEANTIINALGRLPYIEVYDLIAKMQQQAKKQIIEGTFIHERGTFFSR